MEIEGIQWELTTPYNPHQNEVAEKYIQILFEKTRAILYDAGLSNNKWGMAISTIVYLKNGSSTKSLKSITSYETDNGKKSDSSNFHRFGCIAYHHDENPLKKKLSN